MQYSDTRPIRTTGAVFVHKWKRDNTNNTQKRDSRQGDSKKLKRKGQKAVRKRPVGHSGVLQLGVIRRTNTTSPKSLRNLDEAGPTLLTPAERV